MALGESRRTVGGRRCQVQEEGLGIGCNAVGEIHRLLGEYLGEVILGVVIGYDLAVFIELVPLVSPRALFTAQGVPFVPARWEASRIVTGILIEVLTKQGGFVAVFAGG